MVERKVDDGFTWKLDPASFDWNTEDLGPNDALDEISETAFEIIYLLLFELNEFIKMGVDIEMVVVLEQIENFWNENVETFSETCFTDFV